MRMIERARVAVERRLSQIEQAARTIAGMRVERSGGELRVSAPRRRWLEEARLRFLGRGR